MLPIHQFGSFDRKIKFGNKHTYGNIVMVYSLNFVCNPYMRWPLSLILPICVRYG